MLRLRQLIAVHWISRLGKWRHGRDDERAASSLPRVLRTEYDDGTYSDSEFRVLC